MAEKTHGLDEREVAPRRGGARLARKGRGVVQLIDALRDDPELGPRFVHWREIPARPERTAPIPERLDARLVELLRERGVERLYTHQARAIELALEQRDVLVAKIGR